MTIQKETDGILDLLICPGFCVKENIITQVNQAAAAMLLNPGQDVRPLLLTGAEEYAQFQDGCLYLKLKLGERCWGTTVVRREDTDYFLIDQPEEEAILQALSLAARELRGSMTGAMIAADQLAQQFSSGDPQMEEQLSRLNRGLYRMLRLIGNMSDAKDWPHVNRQETREAGSLFAEILEKARTLAGATGITLNYEGLKEEVYTLADRDQLERAVLNLVSNAMKFTPKGGTIQVTLSRRRRILCLSVLDKGSGIQENIRSTVFHRYLRQPSLEDSRFGLGLGMVLVRSAAAAHGGTVLLDQPEGWNTRVTLTLAIRQDTTAQFRSPILGLDYAGERDHVLLELSDCLPLELYGK